MLPRFIATVALLVSLLPAARANNDSLESLWQDLAASDEANVRQAYRSMQVFARFGSQAVAFLGERLRPASSPDAECLARWIDDLDSTAFTRRIEAEAALEKIGLTAGPALRERLERKPPLEMQRRIESLLQRLDVHEPTAEDLRQLRAVEVLAAIGGAEARELLDTLAAGAPGARLTEAARQALPER